MKRTVLPRTLSVILLLTLLIVPATSATESQLLSEKVTGGGQIKLPGTITDCGGPPPPPEEIIIESLPPFSVGHARATFGFNAKRVNGISSGHLNYVNHQTKAHLVCDVNFVNVTGNTATFSGFCSPDSASPIFEVCVTDNGEPGTTDVFVLLVGDGLPKGGVIRNGNIQVH